MVEDCSISGATHCACILRIRQTREGKGRESLAAERRWRRRKEWRRCTVRQWQSDCSSVDAVAGEARWWCAARRCSVSGTTKARQWRTARRRQRGGSSAEAAADSPAPSVNGRTQVPSNATDSPTYASSSLVEDGGTTASTASSSSPRRRRPWRRPLQSPMRRRCR